MRKEHFGFIENLLDFKTPTVFAAFLELPPDSLNSNKAKRGRQTTALGLGSTATRPHGVGPAPGCAPTGDGPTNSCCLFFLKALFLRLQKTQPQKSIRTIKKRHKLASSMALRSSSRLQARGSVLSTTFLKGSFNPVLHPLQTPAAHR